MTRISDTKARHRLAGKIALTVAIAACLTGGALVASASADDRRGWDHDRDHRGWHGGGYYAPPPVVYGTPYYAPPPVVYGTGIGINLPGVSIGIR